jgi:hypothetical protein
VPCCTWEVFAKFVHHMRHVARMVSYTKTFQHQISKLRLPGRRATVAEPAARVRDPQGEALWELQFDRDWETKLNTRRRKIGSNPVPHPDLGHLLELPERDVGAETTDEEDDGELGELGEQRDVGTGYRQPEQHHRTELEPEPEPEAEPERSSSDEDDLV